MRKLILIVVLFGLADVILTAMPEGPLRERREIQELALMSQNALGAVPAPPTTQLLARIQKRSSPENRERVRRSPTSYPVIIGNITVPKSPRNRRAPKPTSIVRIAIATTPKPRIRRTPKPTSIIVPTGPITKVQKSPRNRRAPKPTSIVRIAIATTPKPKRVRRDSDIPASGSAPFRAGRSALLAVSAPRFRRNPKPTSRLKTCCRV
ncbi:hypothetical protein DdX_11799 [Ditylenchus destructor]|uniref:Uncharacterized protein n=1 Tax=Ditylenchus destructor TaxID=166010 RepID=A0AAD4R473_9BILA|nr:hypothetical protein DdX_11799 [Ditylenchus destructor]